MSLIIKGMCLPKHAAFNGEKDTIYQCAVVVHKDNTAELVVRREPASPFANCNGAHIDKHPLVELPTPHGRLIDADAYTDKHEECGWLDDITVDEFNAITPTIIEAEVSEGWITTRRTARITGTENVRRNVIGRS